MTPHVDVRDDVARVTPSGDVDVDTVADLRIALISLLLRGPVTRIVVDLRHATFVDSRGIGVLVAAHRTGRRRGVAVELANVGPLVRSVLQIVGLYETLAPLRAGAPANRGPYHSVSRPRRTLGNRRRAVR